MGLLYPTNRANTVGPIQCYSHDVLLNLTRNLNFMI